MKRRRRVVISIMLFSFSIVHTPACNLLRTDSKNHAGINEDEADIGKGLDLEDLTFSTDVVITRDFVKALATEKDDLSAELSDEKWEAVRSEKSALKFLRSYPNAYYAELQQVREGAGPIGLCFGDAHIENFGFVVFENNRVEYVFNDFDDAEYCPIGLDILRYLVSLKLYEESVNQSKSQELISEIVELYVKSLNEKLNPEDISDIARFDPEKDNKKNLQKYTKNNAFHEGTDQRSLREVGQETQKEISAGILRLPRFQKAQIHDIVSTDNETGGSAGLTRYWVFLQLGTSEEIFELKPKATPGAYFGKWEPPPGYSRPLTLELLRQTFWKGLNAIDHVPISIFSKPYLLRSRTKGSVDLKDLNQVSDRKDLYAIQVSLIAKHHKAYWQSFGVKGKKQRKELVKWLLRNTDKLADRYQRTFQAALRSQEARIQP